MGDTTYSTAEIAELLAEHRPDRYTAGDITWASDVVDAVADNIPTAEARRRTAEQIIRSIERNATRSTNQFMREVLNTGVLPLDWDLLGASPMSIADDRVCLRALTASDLRVFANAEEDAATKDHRARMDSVSGARALADLLDSHGCATVEALATAMQMAVAS